MSITYEEALGTLQAMFGEPWTRESLDAVLRHEKGHMENTCERILNHGSQHPQVLLERLQSSGGGNNNGNDLDPQSTGRGRRQGGGTPSSSSSVATPNALPSRTKRGTPTDLPTDFLRIPGYNHPSAGTGAESGAAVMDDETLARMLQDELFSEELARNPDFAHLARGGRGGGGGVHRGAPPGQRRVTASNAPAPNPFDGVPNVMENLSKLGEGARRRLQMFAVNFENRLNGRNTEPAAGAPRAGILQADAGAVAERRGLLDDDGEEEIEFEMREKKSK